MGRGVQGQHGHGLDPKRRLPGGSFHGGDEAVTAAGECFHEARAVGGIAQGIAQSFDGAVHAGFEVHERVFRPELSPQLLPGHDFTRAFKHQRQDSKGLVGQLDLGPVAAQLAGPGIGFEDAEPNRLPRSVRGRHRG